MKGTEEYRRLQQSLAVEESQVFLADDTHEIYTYCMPRRLESIPAGTWLCPRCIKLGVTPDRVLTMRAAALLEEQTGTNKLSLIRGVLKPKALLLPKPVTVSHKQNSPRSPYMHPFNWRNQGVCLQLLCMQEADDLCVKASLQTG